MDLSKIKPAKGSVKSKTRTARGQGSGKGGTATRGHKGQKSRSGYSRRRGFEGGQMPLQRRIPKYGFKNINRKAYKAINLSTIEALAEKGYNDLDFETMRNVGLVSRNDLVKVLANGELSKKVNVKAHAFSKKAQEMIEAQGGTAEIIEK